MNPRLPVFLRYSLFALSLAVPSITVAAQSSGLQLTGTAAPRLSMSIPPLKGKERTLDLTDILYEGKPLGASALQTRDLAEGVHEITATMPAVGTWQFHVRDDSFYYGMGERFGDLDHAHSILKNLSRDTGFAKGTSSYKPMPFFMSTAGYGLWVDTYSAATFDFNISSEDIVISSVGAKLRIVLIEGPQFPLILNRFTALTGRTQLPPYWAFAPWKARDAHRNIEDVYEDIDKTRALGLPASVLLIDSPWATNFNTFEINRKQFSDPEAMVKRIHEEGFKLCFWLTPFVDKQTNPIGDKGIEGKVPLTEAENYAEGDRGGFFVKNPDGTTHQSTWWKGSGGLVDFTNPAAKLWWQGQVGKAIKLGADAFKDDDGEGNFIGDVRFADGSDARTMRMRYTVLYNNAMNEAIQQQLHGNGVLFMRSASVGSHNLSMHWSGDNEGDFSYENGLPSVVRAGLSAGMSGMSLWVSDLGGYLKKERTPEDAILFERWTQYSAFSPAMQVMSQLNTGPWDWGDEALNIYRKYAILHMSLFPYRYAAAQESARTGMPMMRALVLNHQNDDMARKTVDEYEFGPDLLIAPMLAPGTQRAVYLPEGDWLDFWTGKHLDGRQRIVAEVPVARTAVYIRQGSILPKIPEDVMTLVPPSESGNMKIHSLDDRRIYEVFPGPARQIEDFEGRKVQTTVTAGTSSLSLEGKAATVTLRFKFATPTGITVNGKKVSPVVEDGLSSITFPHTKRDVVAWTSGK